MNDNLNIPLVANKDYAAPSVFLPENLLREARRQKSISDCPVPDICILDPDGDLAEYLLKTGQSEKNDCWACYHSKLYNFRVNDTEIGIIPCIVGASYAVLVAEQLFVSGCKHLISVTSAGIINQPLNDKKFALLIEAIRDEGTSYHYLPPQNSVKLAQSLRNKLMANLLDNCPYFEAKSWTTDAPYRETQLAISAMEKEQITCVEMEASALYAFAEAKSKNVICFAHLTNTMAQNEGDFEKGEHFGSLDTLNLLSFILKKLIA